jgi:molecular chaperone IbpA
MRTARPCIGRSSDSTVCRPRRSRPARGRGLSPYNIERLDENSFQISVALAGFSPDEVALTVEQNVLTLEGSKSEKESKTFLHRGISTRNFKRQFTLADHVEVKGARFENGLLFIDLQRELPEAKKPRRIAIGGAIPRQRHLDRVRGRLIGRTDGPDQSRADILRAAPS